MGNCLKRSCPGGRGRGKSKITFCCSCNYIYKARHWPRGEDCLFPGKSLGFVADWLENNLSKLKSVFGGTFVMMRFVWCVLEWMAASRIKKYFFSVFIFIIRRLKSLYIKTDAQILIKLRSQSSVLMKQAKKNSFKRCHQFVHGPLVRMRYI